MRSLLASARGITRATPFGICRPPVRFGHEGAKFEGPQMHSAGRTDHLHTPDNTQHTPFDFTDSNYERIARWLSHYPANRKCAGIIPILHICQEQTGGWVPLAAMDKIAKICEVPAMQVYEVASFYSQFNRQPIGKYLVQICDTTPCMLMGSDAIEHALEKHLGIHTGDTTPDGMITLGLFECLGSCVNAPMFWVTDYSDPSTFTSDYYEDLTTESAISIVDSLRKGIKPPRGPQNGRTNACPLGGPTTLKEKIRGPYCRDLSKC